MPKQTLLDKTCINLLRSGFTIKRVSRGCFDIACRKASQVLLVKILEDANSISNEFADSMQKISSYLSATPLIVAEKAGSLLEDNVVYSRFGVATLNTVTFKNALEQNLPFVKSTQAGLVAKVDGGKLKQMREQDGLSLSSIARKIGVSARMFSKYENESSEITINKAMKLYDSLGSEVFSKIDVFTTAAVHQEPPSNPITKKYFELGFEASQTSKAPFDVVARKQKEIILTEISGRNVEQMLALSKLVDADNLVIFGKKEGRKPKNIQDIPALTEQEFLELEEARELIKFIKEFE
jgi:putative transcriptional regulator